jgi:anaerobic magnesium-protoporphyrin IX monomethyl ester cyclase
MGAKLDLVLVNPSSRKIVYQALANDLAALEPPVWAGLMATYARGKGLSVAIVDAEADGLSAESAAARVADTDPRLVAVVVYGHQPSASTQNMPGASAFTRALKELEPDRPTLLVGGHVAALPQRTLEEEAADFVCDGEGPVTVVDLALALRDKGDLNKVRGLWYRDAGLPRYTLPAPLVAHVDHEMPGVAWDLLPMEKYRAHNWHCFGGLPRQPYAAMYTTLGCPYHCTFCCIQAPFKTGERLSGLATTTNSYRRWSPEVVIRDIDLLYTRYGVRNLKIADEMFVLHPKHVAGICDQIIERGYDLNIWAYARVDTVRDGMIDKLRRAGFRWLALGVEAASARVRDEVAKGFDQKDVYSTVRKLQGADIRVIANYIFGLPEDDTASMQATLDLALELNCEFANFYSAMAYPGSPLYRAAIEKGWPLPAAWSGFSQHAVDTLPLPTKHLTAREVLRFRDDAFHAYFTSPTYLRLVEERFGAETARHIREMTAHRLERKFAS